MYNVPSTRNKQKMMKTIRMFQELPLKEIAEIERISTLTHVTKGHTFYQPETTSESVFILLEGRVHQYRINMDGKKLITAIFQPQAFFDATSLPEHGMHFNFAEAVEDSLVLALQYHEFKRMLLAHPRMLMYMLAETQNRLTEVEEKMESVAFKGVMGRIVELLLKLAKQQGSNRIEGYTHQEIAESIGTYRETATQILNELRTLGYIAIGRKSIDILNERELALIV